MNAPKIGDRVRCTLGESVLVGTVFDTLDGKPWHIDAEGLRLRVSVTGWTVEVITPPLPPEPPVGSVVRSGGGFLYERSESGWNPSSSYLRRYTWAELQECGPVTLLIPATQVVADVRALEAGKGFPEFWADELAAKYGIRS